MKNTALLLLAFLFTTLSCSQFEDSLLIGQWKAVELLEENQKLEVPLEEVSLEFGVVNAYFYNSTLNYKEAGTYYFEEPYLFTVDTIHQASSEKAVQVVKLTNDSLHLKMQENGKDRLLKLLKVN